LVLGMHRSGTSALARIVNLLGVDLGPDLLPPATDNETGFWEHRQVQFIHDRIYESLGCDWTHVSALPPRWWERPEIEPYRAQLREILGRDFRESRLWGVKDPRLCFMLPLWRPLLRDLKCRPKCVLIFRSPAEVAGSLQKRDGIAPSRTYLLWLRSLMDCERGSRGMPRTITTYEMMLSDWQAQARRIGGDLDIDWPLGTGRRASGAIAEFIRSGSRHHQVDDRKFLADADVPELVRRGYAATLEAAASGRPDDLSPVVEQIAAELDQGQPMLTRFVEDFETEHRSGVVARNLEAIEFNEKQILYAADLAVERKTVEDLKAKLAQMHEQRVAQELHIRHLQLQGRHLTDDAQARIQALASVAKQLRAAQAEIARLEQAGHPQAAPRRVRY
jgi:hypothetical protein